jgi:hypothetical protein
MDSILFRGVYLVSENRGGKQVSLGGDVKPRGATFDYTEYSHGAGLHDDASRFEAARRPNIPRETHACRRDAAMCAGNGLRTGEWFRRVASMRMHIGFM